VGEKPIPRACYTDFASSREIMKHTNVKLLMLAAAMAVLMTFHPGASAANLSEPPGPSAQPSGVATQSGDADNQAPGEQNAPTASSTSPTRGTQANPSGSKSDGTAAAQVLANQANNPTAPLTLFQFRDIWVPSAHPANGIKNVLELQPVVPIGPFEWLPLVQLVKMTLPLLGTTPAPGSVTGAGDLAVFDLFTVNQSWGRWGFGPYLVFPTASQEALGQGKYQAGPAAGVIYTGIRNLIAGVVLQNPISYAGSSSRPAVNQLLVAPTLTYNLAKGWFVGLSDFQWTFDWKNNGAATIPAGVQMGKVLRIGKQPTSLSIEIGRAAARPGGTPDPGWIFGFAITPIFNFHIGPGQKIHLRGKGGA
jgi:hypothetical protein